jgi:hypothetical protein
MIVLVLLIWSLCELLMSPPCILGDEAPHRTEALIKDSEHSNKLHAQNERTLYFLLGSMAVLSHLSVTSFQPMINNSETSILMASGKLRGRFYILIRKMFPCHLAKSKLPLHRVTDESRPRRDGLHETSGIIWLSWVEHDPLYFDIVLRNAKRESWIWQ